jgi:hypothetical protein
VFKAATDHVLELVDVEVVVRVLLASTDIPTGCVLAFPVLCHRTCTPLKGLLKLKIFAIDGA